MSQKVLKYFVSVLAVFAILLLTNGQEPSKFAFDGYLSGMPQYSRTTTKIDTLSDLQRQNQYLLHNRLNFFWYPTDKITGTIQFRNQLMYGGFVKSMDIENGLVSESYFLPLTFQQTFSDAGLLSISTDRAWLQYTHNKLEVKLGRQRINWGQTFVWNPNDIFNAYNFFDFDYAERPGADAVRILYYPTFTSTIDMAVKVDSGKNITAAGLFRFNTLGTDFQLIGGYYSQSRVDILNRVHKESDYIMGGGVTGDVKGISIRSEATYMLPTKDSYNTNDLLLWSVGLDYSFQNQLYISSEFFYSSRVQLTGGNSIFDLYNAPLTVKNLAFAKYSGFAQASYPITPLFQAAISGMYFKDENVKGYFFGPYFDYSVADNIAVSLYFQLFDFKLSIFSQTLKTTTSFAFLRVKWNF